MISKEILKTILKETYLEITNEHSVPERYSDKEKIIYVASKFRNEVLQKIEALNQVYVLLAVYDMRDCTDSYGETAGEREKIAGIFTKLEKAERVKKSLELDNQDAMNECNCDPVYYKIVPWDMI